MTKSAKLVGVFGGIAAVAALIAYYIVAYLIVAPPNVQAAGQAPSASVTLQTVASMGYGPHPDWVSYLVENAQGKWEHSTVLTVPANSLVKVTVLPVRHRDGAPQPVLGRAARDRRRDGCSTGSRCRRSIPTSPRTPSPIPELGVSVPLAGRGRRREEPVQRRAVHARRGAPDDHVHLPDGQARHLPLAVLRALRRRVHPRLRRADAEHRLHGRTPARRLMMASAGFPSARAADPGDLARLDGGRDAADRARARAAPPARGHDRGGLRPDERQHRPDRRVRADRAADRRSTSATRSSSSGPAAGRSRTARPIRGHAPTQTLWLVADLRDRAARSRSGGASCWS